jgi:hypothetical protein
LVAALTLQGDSVSTASGGSGYLVPPSGTINQVLSKTSISDGAFQWKTLTKSDVGLGNVDNTAGSDEPLSTATVSALALKANAANPSFSGDLTTPNLTLSNLSTATQSEVLYVAANGVVSKGAAPI